jgi:RNA polymerase sigma factor (TIGR02999 family)
VESSVRGEITVLLDSLSHGDLEKAQATNRLFELVYAEMRRIAASLMNRERSGHTLQPTALVHEAYLRLVDQSRVRWEDRAHFFRIAVGAMRRILVDHARTRAADKRGGGWQRVTLDEAIGTDGGVEFEIVALDHALARLATMDDRMEQVVTMRVFGGMEMKEIAHALGVSERTVYDDWQVARRWLGRELAQGSQD